MQFKIRDKKTNEPRKFPTLFQEIINNDEQLRLTKASPVVQFGAFKQQRATQLDYRRQAKKIYEATENDGKNE